MTFVCASTGLCKEVQNSVEVQIHQDLKICLKIYVNGTSKKASATEYKIYTPMAGKDVCS
jgi:hypothetical protein